MHEWTISSAQRYQPRPAPSVPPTKAWTLQQTKNPSTTTKIKGMKRTCWTTGSWRSCLSLEVVSSIPTGSTIIYRFLCGFICVSLCRSIKFKPTNMHIASARAQFKINIHRCWNWHLCIPDVLSVVQCSLGHVIGVAFFYAISVAWRERAIQLAAGGVASVWRSWVRSQPGPW